MNVPRLTSAAQLTAIREEISDGALRLAYHAAVPVVINPTLLNLFRVNFFLDPPDAVPHETEAALLLSPLFREIGEDLYEIEPDVRNLLLTGLYSRYGPERVRRVALLLEQYTDATLAWHAQPELERAQQLAALSFVDPARASQWLESAGPGSLSQTLGREWYVAMQRRIARQSTVASASEEIARALSQLTHKDRRIREGAISTLAALTHLPETDPAPVVAALTEFIRRGTRHTERVAPDIQAALSLTGTLPHDNDLDFARITLIGADLGSLDFSKVDFSGAQLIGIKARGINLTGSELRNALIKDSVMDGARLDGASLQYAMLVQVSLTGATLVGVNMDAVKVRDVDLSRADLRNTRLVISEADNVRLDGAMVDSAHIEVRPRSAEATEVPESARAAEEAEASAVTSGQEDSTPRAVLALGQSLAMQGDLEGARANYQRASDYGDLDVVAAATIGLGDIHLRMGEYNDARRAYEKALDVYGEIGGGLGEGDALAHDGLGWADLETGRIDEAREHYERALTIFRQIGYRQREAETLNGLGVANVNRGAVDEAGRCFEQALTIFRETADRRGQGQALSYLGMVNADRGMFDQAEQCSREALEIFTEIGDPISKGHTLADIGTILMQREKFQEAKHSYKQALAIFHETGADAAAANVRLQLARAYERTGDLDQAITLYEQSTADSERTMGPDHPETQILWDYLAGAYWMAGRVEDALRLHESVLASRRRTIGDDDPATLTSASSLAADLRTLGRLNDALALDQGTYDRRRRVLGKDHPDTLTSASSLAADLRTLGRLNDALALDQGTYDRRRRVLGEDHPDTLTSASSLAADLRTLGRLNDALALDQGTYDRRRRVLGEDHPDTLTSASNLAADLRVLHRKTEAHALDQDTYDRRRRVLGEDHPDTLTSASNLAVDLREVGETPRVRDASPATPTVGDYFRAVQAPGSAFTVPELQTAMFVQDSLGPAAVTGRSAVVFQAEVAGRLQAVRCYIRSGSSNRERYSELGAYLASHDLSPYVSAATWLDSAIRVNDATWPVVLTNWIDGRNLDQYVDLLVEGSNTTALAMLAQRWRELIRTLQRAEFAHGGMQHSDVMVAQEGRLRLVDYDTIWIPPMQGFAPPSEPGHRNYEHPGGRVWGRWMDTFPELVIYLSLMALAKEPGLWPTFYNGENLLFVRADFFAPFETPVWSQLASLHDPEIDKLARCLQECCAPGWVATKSFDKTIDQA